MERRIRRRSKRFHRKHFALSLVATLALGLSLYGGPRVVKLVPQLFNAGRQSIWERASGMMRLEDVSWEEVGSTNLSHRVSKELLNEVGGLRLGDEVLKIDLASLEKRLLAVPWIESVQIQKKLPSSLAIHYTVHQARALGLRKNKLWLISSAGKWIAPAGHDQIRDLPLLTNGAGDTRLEFELNWLQALEAQFSAGLMQIQEVNGSAAVGSKLTTLVELKYGSGRAVKISIVTMGSGAGQPNPEMLIRLKRVVQYLIKNNILVSSIDLRPGKKVVVNVGKRP